MEGPLEGREADSDCSPEDSISLWKQGVSPPGTGFLLWALVVVLTPRQASQSFHREAWKLPRELLLNGLVPVKSNERFSQRRDFYKNTTKVQSAVGSSKGAVTVSPGSQSD